MCPLVERVDASDDRGGEWVRRLGTAWLHANRQSECTVYECSFEDRGEGGRLNSQDRLHLTRL